MVNKKRFLLSGTIRMLPILFLFISSSGCSSAFTEEMEVRVITVGGVDVEAEIAATPSTRERGLMYRKSLSKDSGMLFVFPRTSRQAFWMKNTFIPLDVGFFDQQGFLTEVIPMETDNGKTIYRSAEPARYALEMNQGWFKAHRLKKYAKLDLKSPIRGW